MTRSLLPGCVFPLPGSVTFDASPDAVFFASEGGAIGTIALSLPAIPGGATVLGGYVEEATRPTSGGG